MELLVKPDILTSYIYELTFGNVEILIFLLAAQYFNIESMQKNILSHLCVNTLTATKVTLITNGIYFGSLRVNLFVSSVLFVFWYCTIHRTF
jgi:hypothetical protein